ncbi:MAG: DUF5305 family protein [Lutispora sp.]|nr:DUF5305 family protein [Lutispora sp.]MDD4833212.1 DUF5305 family protein [Lutispora sp.]
MRITKIRIFGEINKKYRPYIVGVIVILCITFTLLAYQAIRQPLMIEEKVIANTIEEKVIFDYVAVVKPSTLYPQGGKVVPDQVIFYKLADKLIIQLDASINSARPVRIEGSIGVVFRLVAKDMWEREFELVAAQPINTEGISHSLLHEEIHLDLKELFSFIEKVEEETLVRSSNYTLLIKPKIEGTVYQKNENKAHEIISNIEIPFQLTGQYIKYAAESLEKEFIRTEIIEDVNTVPQSFNFFGKELTVIKARYSFSIVAIILLILIIISIVEKAKQKKEKVNEIYLIDKKHKSKIISISDKAGFKNSPQLGLDSFKALLQIAEEKDEPILRYADDIEGSVYYYIIATPTIYYYRIAKSIVVKGSDLAHHA